MTSQPTEHCGNQPPRPRDDGWLTECVLRPGHSGSHADERGMRWWLHTGEQQPAAAGPANPAYEAVFAYVRSEPHDFLPRTIVDRNAMIWHAVHAALDATPGPEQQGNPRVQGRCPACGGAGLFLGEGGYVTCPRLDCPEPDAASTLLEQPPKPSPAPTVAVEVRGPCPYCGDHQLIPRHRMAEHVARLHSDERRTTTEG